jgi:hypothetical protein
VIHEAVATTGFTLHDPAKPGILYVAMRVSNMPTDAFFHVAGLPAPGFVIPPSEDFRKYTTGRFIGR